MTDPLDTLRPEVRDALDEIDDCMRMDIKVVPVGALGVVRAELLRLATIEADALIALDCEHDWQVEHKRAEKAETELLRLIGENARLNKIESLATEQRLQMEDAELYLMDVSQPEDEDAPWCDRMKSAIELLIQDCNYAVGQKNKAGAELAEMKQSFDLRWKADMRALDHWRREHPGDDLTWPDHADLCVWLMEELAALKARL